MQFTATVSHETSYRNQDVISYPNKVLERTEKEFKALFEQSNDGIIIVREGKFTDCNHRIIEMFGYEKSGFLENTPLDLSPEYQPSGKKSLDGISAKVQAAMAGQVQHFYWQHKKKNGQLFDTDVTVCRFDIGDDIYLQIIVRDITELIHTKELLSNKVIELERFIASNKELEQFAYTTAHDLKEPLRTIQSFAQLLQHTSKDQLSDSASEYLNFMISGVNNMSKLINDLLEYSKVSAQDQQSFQSINLQLLFELVTLQHLRKQIEESGATITPFDLPAEVRGNRQKLGQVFQNLISNAIKFRSKERPCRVDVTAKDCDQYWQFEIRDNGIGIPDHELQRIFEVFTRLNPRKDYEGSGIGLATCQKIVRQHGGRIWASSNSLGQGATFCFTLPK